MSDGWINVKQLQPLSKELQPTSYSHNSLYKVKRKAVQFLGGIKPLKCLRLAQEWEGRLECLLERGNQALCSHTPLGYLWTESHLALQSHRALHPPTLCPWPFTASRKPQPNLLPLCICLPHPCYLALHSSPCSKLGAFIRVASFAFPQLQGGAANGPPVTTNLWDSSSQLGVGHLGNIWKHAGHHNSENATAIS